MEAAISGQPRAPVLTRIGLPAGRSRVKAFGAAAGLIVTLAMLSACAGGWVHPKKNAAELRADEQACNQEAEENTLLRNGRQRVDYGAPAAGAMGGARGVTPMEMHDRSTDVRDFRTEMDRCMEAKGYTRGDGKS